MKKNIKKLELTIAGTRHNMPGETLDEKTDAAVAFLSSLPVGSRFILIKRPDNPYDPKAVASILEADGNHYGYVSAGELDDITPHLDKYGQCEATLSHYDGHVTYQVEVNVSEEDIPEFNPNTERVLTDCPLPHEFMFGSQLAEVRMDVYPMRFMKTEINDETLPDLYRMALMLLDSFNSSLCRNDAHWQRKIGKKINQVHAYVRKHFAEDEETACSSPKEWYRLSDRCQDLIGDYQRSEGHGKIIVRQFTLLVNSPKADEQAEKLNRQYLDETATLLKEMREWIKENLNVVFTKHLDWQDLGHTIAYKRMSRAETCEILSVLVLLHKLYNAPAIQAPEPHTETQNSTKPQKKRGKSKKPAVPSEPEPYMTFRSRGTSTVHLQLLRSKLISENWLSSKTDEKAFIDLFSGRRNKCVIHWASDDETKDHRSKYGKGTLVFLFQRLEQVGIIAKVEPHTIPNILMHHVADYDGVLLEGLDKGDAPNKKALDEVEEFIKLLKFDLTQAMSDDRHFEAEKAGTDFYDDGYDSYDHQDLKFHNKRGG